MLTGKTALITGASRGIGAAIAEELSRLGASVALVYASRDEEAEQIRLRCEANGVTAKAYRCNVADFTAVKETVKQIRADFSAVDILVNNAGVSDDGLLAMMNEAQFNKVLDVNLKGAFHMMRHCTPLFLRQKGGKIINISSVSGLLGNAGQANYSAAKAGLIGLTKAAARELAGKGITCNAVAPGFIATDMTRGLEESALLGQIPLGRLGRPQEVAGAVAFLAGPGGDYITGTVLRVDGGLAIGG